MKKFIFAVMAIATLAFAGCGKDDASPSLIGTVWVKTDTDAVTTLTFKSDIECEWVATINGSANAVAMQYTYEYNHPVVMAYPKVEGYAKMQGMISGNTMNVINTSSEETVAILTKQ